MKRSKYLYYGDFKGMHGIILESRGGAKSSNNQRNPDYKQLRHYIFESLKLDNQKEVEIYIASMRESLYPTLESRKISIDGSTAFDFTKLDFDVFSTSLNTAVRRAGQIGTEKSGNDTKRLFFNLKKTERLTSLDVSESQEMVPIPTLKEEFKDALDLFQFDFNRTKKTKADIKQLVDKFQDVLLNYLKEWFPSFNWVKEHQELSHIKDSFDIYGFDSVNNQHVVIELDPHRADSISKKFVSRLAIMNDKNLLYIAYLYPGTENMSLNEAKKYLDSCNVLVQCMSKENSVKQFLGCFLYS